MSGLLPGGGLGWHDHGTRAGESEVLVLFMHRHQIVGGAHTMAQCRRTYLILGRRLPETDFDRRRGRTRTGRYGKAQRTLVKELFNEGVLRRRVFDEDSFGFTTPGTRRVIIVNNVCRGGGWESWSAGVTITDVTCLLLCLWVSRLP